MTINPDEYLASATDAVVRCIVDAHPGTVTGAALLEKLSQWDQGWIWMALGAAMHGQVIAIKSYAPHPRDWVLGLALVKSARFACPGCGEMIHASQGHDCPTARWPEHRPEPQKYTAETFQARFGFAPKQDDLHRVNCRDAGLVGHLTCGVCSEHSAPVFTCFHLHLDPA